MPFKLLDFKCALITGGSGGIGLALAKHFQSTGKKVIICGRTQSKVEEASKSLQNCPYYVLDVGDTASIRAFVQKLTSEHPDLDCLINNAGVQRPLELGKMDAEEFLEKADQEISINVKGPMHLAVELLPHFRQKEGAVIMNVSSVLGFVPTSVINPVYNATKAWVHFWTMNLRTQLAKSGANIRVVEIAPPTVSTDLHREREDPDDNKKEANPDALSLDEFIREVAESLEKDVDVFGAGPSKKVVDQWNDTFGEQYAKAVA